MTIADTLSDAVEGIRCMLDDKELVWVNPELDQKLRGPSRKWNGFAKPSTVSLTRGHSPWLWSVLQRAVPAKAEAEARFERLGEAPPPPPDAPPRHSKDDPEARNAKVTIPCHGKGKVVVDRQQWPLAGLRNDESKSKAKAHLCGGVYHGDRRGLGDGRGGDMGRCPLGSDAVSEAPDEAWFKAVARWKRRAHGKADWPEFGNWKAMLKRCENPNDADNYSKYGARGITVCERYHHFDAFIRDMGRKPSSKHTIDRIDSRGNYDVGNVRWATASEQANNPTNKPRPRMAPELLAERRLEAAERQREKARLMRAEHTMTEQEKERVRQYSKRYRATLMTEEQRERKRERNRKRGATRPSRVLTEQQMERKRATDRLRRSTAEYRAHARAVRKPHIRTEEQKEQRREADRQHRIAAKEGALLFP